MGGRVRCEDERWESECRGAGRWQAVMVRCVDAEVSAVRMERRRSSRWDG